MENQPVTSKPTQPAESVVTTQDARLIMIKVHTSQWYPRKFDKKVTEEIAAHYGVENAKRAGR